MDKKLIQFPKPGRLILMPKLTFDSDFAVEVGYKEAIFVSSLNFWLRKTKAGKTIGGVRWVYNTYEQWHETFNFWSLMTIRRVIDSCKKQKLIYVSNFNRLKQDNTLWYTINYSHPAITSHCSEWTVGMFKMNRPTCSDCTSPLVQNEQTIPYKDTDVNTGKDDITRVQSSSSPASPLTPSGQRVEKHERRKKEVIRDDSKLTMQQVDCYLREEITYRKVGNPEGYRRTIIRRIWRKSFGLHADTTFEWRDRRQSNELQNGIHLQHAVSRAELYACESI